VGLHDGLPGIPPEIIATMPIKGLVGLEPEALGDGTLWSPMSLGIVEAEGSRLRLVVRVGMFVHFNVL